LGFRYVGLTPLKKVRKLCGEAGDDAHARAHTHTHTHTHTYTHKYICTHVHTHAYTPSLPASGDDCGGAAHWHDSLPK